MMLQPQAEGQLLQKMFSSSLACDLISGGPGGSTIARGLGAFLFQGSSKRWAHTVPSAGLCYRQPVLPVGSLSQHITDDLIDCRLGA